MNPWVSALKELYEANADPIAAGPMAAYMRDQFAFLGIKSRMNGELFRQCIAENGLPPLSEFDTVIRELWALPQREFQYVGVGVVRKLLTKLPADVIGTIEFLIVTKSWWDTVDAIAGDIVGSHFMRYPEIRGTSLARWRKSDNFWLRRTCILFQLNYKGQTDFGLLTEIIRENLGSKEFFINKAIGWALRQYTRIDPDGVREFVATTPLAPLSAREALKWLEKRSAITGTSPDSDH